MRRTPSIALSAAAAYRGLTVTAQLTLGRAARHRRDGTGAVTDTGPATTSASRPSTPRSTDGAGRARRRPVDAGQRARRNVAEIIQRVRPDVLLINEFDFDPAAARPVPGQLPRRSPTTAPPPIGYPLPVRRAVEHRAYRPASTSTTTAYAAGCGLRRRRLRFRLLPRPVRHGRATRGSRSTATVRTFQKFLWKDMPGALLPDDPATGTRRLVLARGAQGPPPLVEDPLGHPVQVGGTDRPRPDSHPTPPTFDGPEDRDGNATSTRSGSGPTT